MLLLWFLGGRIDVGREREGEREGAGEVLR